MSFGLHVAARISRELHRRGFDRNGWPLYVRSLEAGSVRLHVWDRRNSATAAITFATYGRHSWIVLPRLRGAFDRELLAAIVPLFCAAAVEADLAAQVLAVIPLARSAPYRTSLLERPAEIRYGRFLARPRFDVVPWGTSEPRSLGADGDGADRLWNALQDDDKRRTWTFGTAHATRAVAKRSRLQFDVCEPLLDIVWCFALEERGPDAACALRIAWRWNDRVTGAFAIDPFGQAPTHAVALLSRHTDSCPM